ncbi:hypothetical protein DL93DRAFT_633773 [Clavulina sp. PMI_390]|nr:hypothetical protein DL93DRAFT_633773 [Clavulina sp. PMI_390]
MIDGVQNISVWNWRLDTVATLDLQEHSWARGQGFLANLHPPFVYVAPQDGEELHVVELPEFLPRIQSNSPRIVPPRSLVTVPLEVNQPIVSFDFGFLEDWKPLSRRLGLGVILSVNFPSEPESRYSQHMIRTTNDLLGASPKVSLSAAPTLALLPLDKIEITTHVSATAKRETYGYTFEMKSPNSGTPHSITLNASAFQDGEFQPCSTREFAVKFPDDSPKWPWWTTANRLCLPSGATLGYSRWRNSQESEDGLPVARILYIE